MTVFTTAHSCASPEPDEAAPNPPIKFILNNNTLYCFPLTPDARVRSHFSPCEICGGQSDTVTGFSPSTSDFACQYHSAVDTTQSLQSTAAFNNTHKSTLMLAADLRRCRHSSVCCGDTVISKLSVCFFCLLSCHGPTDLTSRDVHSSSLLYPLNP